jgi:hypothetical protein
LLLLLSLLLTLFLPLFLLLFVLRRHSDPERSRMGKNSRISEGSVATRVPFSPTHPNIVISTGAAQALRELRSGETRFSTHTVSQPRFVVACFLVKSPTTITKIQSTTSVLRSSFTQPAIMNTEIKKRAPATRGSFPLSKRNAASHLL